MSNMENTLNILVKLTPHFFAIIGSFIIACGIIVGIHNLTINSKINILPSFISCISMGTLVIFAGKIVTFLGRWDINTNAYTPIFLIEYIVAMWIFTLLSMRENPKRR